MTEPSEGTAKEWATASKAAGCKAVRLDLFCVLRLRSSRWKSYASQQVTQSQLTVSLVSQMMSVGGWSGSETISKLVASESSRSDWAETIVAAMDEYGFEGVDLGALPPAFSCPKQMLIRFPRPLLSDWEYPGKSGATDDARF